MSDFIFDRAARTWWTEHHLRAALTVTMGSIDEGQVGFVNGYVQLPEGHPDLGGDHGDLDLAVHRGLTYGVDERGWVGFGTGHVDDYWADTDIDALIAATPEPRRRSLMRQWHHCRGIKAACRPDPSWLMAWDRDWTIPLLTVEVENLAGQLHTRGLQASPGKSGHASLRLAPTGERAIRGAAKLGCN